MGSAIRRRTLLAGGAAALGMASFARGDAPPRIRFALSDHYPPFNFVGPDGRLRGMLIDAMQLVGPEAGVAIEFHLYPWARAQSMVGTGELDAFCTQPNDERRGFAEFATTPAVIVTYGIFHRADDPRPRAIRTIADLEGLRVGTFLGDGWTPQFLKGMPIAWLPDENAVFRRLAEGGIDVYIEGREIGAYTVRRLNLADRIAFTPVEAFPTGQYCFGLRRSFPDCAAIVARVEAATAKARAAGELDAIRARYA